MHQYMFIFKKSSFIFIFYILPGPSPNLSALGARRPAGAEGGPAVRSTGSVPGKGGVSVALAAQVLSGARAQLLRGAAGREMARWQWDPLLGRTPGPWRAAFPLGTG